MKVPIKTRKLKRYTISILLSFIIGVLLIKVILNDNKGESVIIIDPSKDYDRYHLKYIYPEIIDHLYSKALSSKNEPEINWSEFAYVFYATESLHYCNAMMIIKQLKEFESKAQFLILANRDIFKGGVRYKFDLNKENIKMKLIEVTKNEDGSYWESSFTKLEIFHQFEFKRLIYLDTDAILPNGNLDELFFLPPVKLATVTAYWLTKEKYQDKQQYKNTPEKVLGELERENNVEMVLHELKKYEDDNNGDLQEYYKVLYNSLPNYETIEHFFFSSILMVITPSHDISNRIKQSFKDRKSKEFDMDMLNNHVFRPATIILNQIKRRNQKLDEVDIPDLLLLPHQIYGCLTRELNVEIDHRAFLADPQDQPYIDTNTNPDSDTTNTATLKDIKTKIPYYGSQGITQMSKDWFPKVKYLHFSDSPIPKPWIKKDLSDKYMTDQLRCAQNSIFRQSKLVKPKGFTDDCDAGDYWEFYHDKFAVLRREVCGLILD